MSLILLYVLSVLLLYEDHNYSTLRIPLVQDYLLLLLR
ncbi:hypothetical protein A0H76_3042 [Hepatospora eriocheir]|uniref:Uncharacterized protein n=1 Tax=Hepatospora eriocheir TaxID=1081669 RepID=A0A1X0QGH7_9MICR|nr:hypothetical protein A0H76_3042 [Hepatospora eriocheir]